MFSRRRSLFDHSRDRLSKAPRRQKRRKDQRHARLSVERLEDRRLLAADIDTNLGQFEPYVAVNPADPANVIATQFNQIVISTDYGETFTAPINATLPPALAGAGYGFSGDPVLAFDAAGTTLYWTYLASIDNDGDGNNDDMSIIVQRVNPLTGAQIGTSVDLTPGNFLDDKQWLTVDDDATSPFAGNIYLTWSRLDGNPDQLLFSRSTDGGVTFSAPALISDPNGVDNVLGNADDEEFVWPSHVETAANGDLYVAYHIDDAPGGQGDDPNGGPIVVLRSSNGGADFAAGTVNQKSTAFPAGTAQINDNTQTEATTIAGATYWTQGAFAPYVLADPVNPGRIYVIGNDDPNDQFGNGDDGDVVMTISEDFGVTWSPPQTISHGPAGTLQVFPQATIDELGNIAVFWYDDRAGLTNGAGNFLLDVYATVSRDGGQTFSTDFRVNDVRFDPDLNAPQRFAGPPPTTRIGEYNGIATSQGVVHLVWTGNNPGGGAQEVFYDQFNMLGPFADPWEENDSIATATALGSLPKITIKDATLDTPADADFYKYTADETGKLIVNGLFHDGVADLRLRVLDSAGNLIASGTQSEIVPGSDIEELVIPVVTQEEYWIVVDYDPSDPINNPLVYDLEIENFAAPAPAFVDLTPTSDTGASNSDNITSDTTPTFLVQADLVDFRDMGITLLDQATIDPNNDGDAADAAADGAGVFVTLVNLTTGALVEGFADQVGASGFLWTFTPAAPLAGGDYFVSSAVQMVDGQQDPNRENGRAQLSDPLFITIIDAAGDIDVNADLLTSSDSGMFDDDNVTAKWEPAFQGIAPANTTVRLYANGELVGQTTVGSDTSDVGIGGVNGLGGAANDGLGLWEITSEPLAENGYDITLEIEDGAGNVVQFDPQFNDANPDIDIVIDKTAPNTPLLDLRDDTGENLADEITSDNAPDFFMTTTDPNIALAELLFTDNLKFRIFDRHENNAEVLVYDSAADAAADNVTTAGDMFTSLTALTRTLPVGGGVLAEGTHNFKLEVEDRAGNISEDFLLEVFVDSIAPDPVAPDLLASSDSGMFNDDNVTNKWEPAFDGEAEINNKVFVYATAVNPADGMQIGDTLLIGEGIVGSENSNDVADDGLGRWEVTVEPLVEGVYDIIVRFEDWAGNFTPLDQASLPENTLRIVIDKTEPNTPNLDLITDAVTGDTGRNDVDNITKQNQPVVTMTSEDPNVILAQVLFDDNLKFRIYDRYESFAGQNTPEFLLYDSTQDMAVFDMIDNTDVLTALTLIEETLPEQFFNLFGAANDAVLAGGVLADGVHNLKLEVEDRAGNISHDFLLEIIVDTVTPPVSFGLPNAVNAEDGLAAESDSGVTTDPATFADRVTSDTTPRLWGRAEANTVIQVFHDRNADGDIDLGFDEFLGQTVAVPFDGNDAFVDANGDPLGYWEITTVLDLNEIFGIPKDGVRRLLVTAEDVAGNPMPMANTIADGVDTLNIFIDTQGPQVYDPAGATQAVHPAADPTYNLFDPKPSDNGFTPLTDSIVINVRDLPLRSNVDPNFLYEALQEEIAEIVGNYTLVGDHVGPIGIVDVNVINAAAVNNQQATATIEIQFADFLPDDRYTLTISDNLVDPAGNNFDGESNTTGPLDLANIVFPSGDGVPGGDFVARFTIDSRPEIGSYVSQNIDIDINGNFVWDPSNDQIGNDATNVDLTFTLGVANANGTVGLGRFGTHDLAFAGKFTNGNAPASGNLFDQLAAYGWSTELNQRRWLIDTDSDGVVTLGTDILSVQPDIAGFNVAGAIPVAGNFDGNAANGDEIGLYYSGQWALDVDRDFVIEPAEVLINNGLFGRPIIGDFDGDGLEDAAVFNNNVFYFDMAATGGLGNFNGNQNADQTLVWGFPGVLDRPVAADFDQDGIDDLGLWVPRNSAQDNRVIAEWYFLISADPNGANRIAGTINTLDHPFEPVPFGNDLYAEFGDELALPIVGNFDPPVTAEDVAPEVVGDTGDFDQDGDYDGADFLAWQRGLSMSGTPSMTDGDGNSDGVVDQTDLQLWSDAYQATVALASDYNGDDWVDGGDLQMWSANYGTVTTPGAPGDGDNNGVVNGSDFLRWQRSVQSPSFAALSVSVSSPPPAVVAAVQAEPLSVDIVSLGSVYASSLQSDAKDSAFEVLQAESDVLAVDADQPSSTPLSALASAVASESEATGNLAASEEAEAWDLAFDDESLDGELN